MYSGADAIRQCAGCNCVRLLVDAVINAVTGSSFAMGNDTGAEFKHSSVIFAAVALATLIHLTGIPCNRFVAHKGLRVQDIDSVKNDTCTVYR